MTGAAVKLSCERCRRRKTKCDKGTPCSNCNDAGISCSGIERARLPRGPSGKVKNRNAALATRVARLESLLKQAERQTQLPSDDSFSPGAIHPRKSTLQSNSPQTDKIGQLYAKDIWTTLSEEVTGLRETLDASDDDSRPTDVTQGRSEAKTSLENLSRKMFFNHAFDLNEDSVKPPSASARAALLRLYQERVDCLFKITHWPTVVTTIEKQYNGDFYQPSSPPAQALEFSVYFLAICSVSDQESQEVFFENRPLLLQRFRFSAERLISNANLLDSPDLITLQAFVIYLEGIRSCMQYTATWTLLATAVRVANSLGLPVSETEGWSLYELEIRKRIFFCIDILDFQTAVDRGSVPLLLFEDSPRPPLLTTDSECSSPVIRVRPQLDTDMSFAYIYREALTCIKALFPRSTTPQNQPDDWRAKLRVVAAFRESMEQHSVRILDPTSPIRLCAQYTTTAIAMDMELFLRRPPFRVKHSTPPPWDVFDILGKTTEILEVNLARPVNTTFAPWAWFAKPWVRWYILAVLLAELCTPREGELAEKAYRVAKESFSRYGELITDTDLRTLWKPLVKLMHHVERVRQNKPADSTIPTPAVPSAAELSGIQHQGTSTSQRPAKGSHVILSYELDAREKVMEWVSTGKRAAIPDDAEVWKEYTNDWEHTAADLADHSTPSRVWDSFLGDLGGYNRCFM